MKQALKNIFKKPETTTFTATVTDVFSQGRVEVLDQARRYHTVFVDTGTFYPKGVSVVIQNGRVIGNGSGQNIKHVKL